MKLSRNKIFENKILIPLLMFIITRDKIVLAQIKLSQMTDAVLGKPFSLACTTTTLVKTVFFHGTNGTLVGSCMYGGECGSGLGYNLMQNITDRKTIIVIPKADRYDHEGTWKCTYGTEEDLLTVKVLTIPNTITMTGLASDIVFRKEEEFQVLVSCSCGCAYPEVTFDWQFINTGSNKSVYSLKSVGEIDSTVFCSRLEIAQRNSILISNTTMLLLTTTNPIRLKCNLYIKNMLHPKQLSKTSLGAITFPDVKRVKNNQHDTINGGGIAGIVITVFIVAILVTLAIYIYIRKRKTKFKHNGFHDISDNAGNIDRNVEYKSATFVTNEGGNVESGSKNRHYQTKHVTKEGQEMHDTHDFSSSIVSNSSLRKQIPNEAIQQMQPGDCITVERIKVTYYKGDNNTQTGPAITEI